MRRATVFHPDDPLFARLRWRMRREQGTRAARRGDGLYRPYIAALKRATGGKRRAELEAWLGRNRLCDDAS